MNNERKHLSVSSLFYDGKLFQIGDLVSGEGEYLDTGYGFTKFKTGGVITAIIIEEEGVCNSAYLNHGMTYSSIGGLGFIFELDGVRHFAFENKNIVLPSNKKEQVAFFSAYYNHGVNSDKLKNLVEFVKRKYNRVFTEKELLQIGKLFAEEFPILFDYFFYCLLIRSGMYGAFKDSNELSNIAFKVLREHAGYDNKVNNIIHQFCADNPNRSYKEKDLLKPAESK